MRYELPVQLSSGARGLLVIRLFSAPADDSEAGEMSGRGKAMEELLDLRRKR